MIEIAVIAVKVQNKSSEKTWDESDLHRDMEHWKQQQLELHKVDSIHRSCLMIRMSCNTNVL